MVIRSVVAKKKRCGVFWGGCCSKELWDPPVVFFGAWFQEEAAVVTGQQKAEAAARSLLSRKDAFTRWCVVKQGAHGATLASKDPANGAITIHQSPGFKVGWSNLLACV